MGNAVCSNQPPTRDVCHQCPPSLTQVNKNSPVYPIAAAAAAWETP